MPQKCSNADGLETLYMTHIDSPGNTSIRKRHSRCFNGADIEGQAPKSTERGKKLAIYDVLKFVREQHEEIQRL